MKEFLAEIFTVSNEVPIQRSLEIRADFPVPNNDYENVDFMVQAIRHHISTFRVYLPKGTKINTSFVVFVPTKTLDSLYEEFCVDGEDKRPNICFHSLMIKYTGAAKNMLTEFTTQFFFKDMPEDTIWLNVMVA